VIGLGPRLGRDEKGSLQGLLLMKRDHVSDGDNLQRRENGKIMSLTTTPHRRSPMVRMRLSLVLTLAATFLVAPLAFAADPPATFTIDPAHTSVTFKVRHLLTKVEGTFRDVSGTITGDPKDPAHASVEFSIKAASIDTRNDQRDKHLRSADFFDVEKFPEITFKSTKIIPKGGELYDVVGQFSMHGVTKEITVPVDFAGTIKDPWGNTRAGFSVALTLNRKDYGISWNKTLDQGGLMLGDDVEISIDVEAVNKKK
jgi:polyisoprenoid-binding protein YceI